MMIGDAVVRPSAARTAVQRQDGATLEIAGLFTENDEGRDAVAGFDIKVRPGEIVGIAGVSGNGQSELVEALSGQRPIKLGQVLIRDANFEPTRDHYDRYKVYGLPEEPLKNASVPTMSVAENMAFRIFDKAPMSRLGFWLSGEPMRATARDLISRYNVKTPSTETQIRDLSGGNIQRAILARELLGRQPESEADIGGLSKLRNAMFSATDMIGTVAFFSGSSGRPNTLKRSKWSRFGSKFWSRISICPSLIGRCPDKRLDELALAVAGNAGDADDLAGADLDDRSRSTASRPSSFSTKRPAISSIGPPSRRSTRAARRAHDRIADHHRRHLARRHRADLAAADPAPRRSTLTSSQNASTSRNLWLIISDGDLAAMRHVAQQPEDFVGFTRRQHRGRLVENEEALIEIEQLQDFELLLFARRERRDRPVERHAKRHAVEERFERLASPCAN